MASVCDWLGSNSPSSLLVFEEPDSPRGEEGGGAASLISDKNTDEETPPCRPLSLRRSRSTTSGVTGILPGAISGDGTDLSSGVRTLLTPKGGTREGNAILELGT